MTKYPRVSNQNPWCPSNKRSRPETEWKRTSKWINAVTHCAIPIGGLIRKILIYSFQADHLKSFKSLTTYFIALLGH